MQDLASPIVVVVSVYATLGAIFAVAFVLLGTSRIDPAAKQGSVGFKLLILPGCLALWPLLAKRWWTGSPPPVERNSHRDAVDAGRAES